MNESLVSIIVPVYNVENYISDCIESIIKQSYSNIEIIIIDDGSTDNSLAICNEYASKDNRIKLISKMNEGVAIARNTGLKKANGDWIMFVDSDDWIEIDAVKILLTQVDSDNIDMVMANYCFNYSTHERDMSQFSGDERKITVENYIPSIYGSCIINSLFFSTVFPKELQFGTLLHYPVLKLYKNKIIKDNKVMFPIKLKQNEDKIFNVNYLRHTNIIKYIPKSIYHYRIREGMASHGVPENLYKQFLEAINKWREVSEKFKVDGILIDSYCRVNSAMLCKALSSSLVNKVDGLNDYKMACNMLRTFCQNENVKVHLEELEFNIMPNATLKTSIWLLKHNLYGLELAIAIILKWLKGKRNVH